MKARQDLHTPTRYYVQTSYGDQAVDRVKAAIGRKNLHYDRTLGSLAEFVKRQKDPAAGDPCADCGKRGELHRDLEDGLWKCYSCCDIPE